jgi:hypothetical protein
LLLITFGLSYVTDYKSIEIAETSDEGHEHEYRVVSGYKDERSKTYNHQGKTVFVAGKPKFLGRPIQDAYLRISWP